MAKKKRLQATPVKRQKEKNIFSDALDDDILMKLKAAKKDLLADEQTKEEERQEQLRKDREEREKNKTFAELLDEYDKETTKY
ncbi:YqkE family protein [Sporosarcina oncorhynchi]|uniref:YqkE family protein n=1 Tax=Sporosarcina oncorhynchi TaxID=3056444 RepID=A0ABZ0L076_9BACL|nr:YqkE family protein [Sporosarcina sp. T2O-4]WOV86031.1 YqkE family protein [Sporosarcina sp. T2O-4]